LSPRPALRNSQNSGETAAATFGGGCLFAQLFSKVEIEILFMSFPKGLKEQKQHIKQ
jgi:hypothetical protein